MKLGEEFSVTSDYDLTDYGTDTHTRTDYKPRDDFFDFKDFRLENLFDTFFGFIAILLGFFAILMGIVLALYLYYAIVISKIAQKAKHQNPWAGWVPVYNLYVLAEVSGYEGWLGILAAITPIIIPGLGLIVSLVLKILILNKLSLSFGKDAGFTVGLVLLNPIFMGILAFSNMEYVGPGGDKKIKPVWLSK